MVFANITSSCFVLFLLTIVISSNAVSASISDCAYYDFDNGNDVFVPWHDYALSNHACHDRRSGVPGTCVGDRDTCLTNSGSGMISTESCRQAFGGLPNAECCRVDTNCTADPILAEGGSQLKGVCLQSSYCTNGVSSSSACGVGSSCCVEQLPQTQGVSCPSRYQKIYNRISFLNLKLENMGRCTGTSCFTNNRLTNFLPFALKTFENLRSKKRCAHLGDCAAATYIAFFYHMLHDFTIDSPSTVLESVLHAVGQTSPNAADAVKNELQKAKFAGHMSPEAFGRFLDILWEDERLDLVQYNGGTCADWIRMADAVRGSGHGWRCDIRWSSLISSHYCRPTNQSNLADCASGAGVCYINGNSNDVCESSGLEQYSSAGNTECRERYGNEKAFCCKKTTKYGTKMTFAHNEYRDVRIAIDPSVVEDASLIENLKLTFTAASGMLYVATGDRALFRSVRIILPDTWSSALATEKRTDESVGEAEFTIKPDLSWENDGVSPHRVTMTTLQLGYCGSRGLGTTLTPKDISGALGPANIAKHFSFNRYGIFREFPQNEHEMQPLGGFNGLPPRCAKDNGTFYFYCNETLDISVNSTSNVTSSLAWVPDYTNYVNVKHIVHFCDSRQCDPTRHHNEDMDNTHNTVCNRKPTLNVIVKNDDFEGSGTPPRHSLDTRPTFAVVHRSFGNEDDKGSTTPSWNDGTSDEEQDGTSGEETESPQEVNTRVVLVLDVSGSMTGLPIKNEKDASAQFVDLVDPAMEVGVVTFNSEGATLSPLTAGDSVGKSSLKSSIYGISAGGGTCGEKGLDRAADMLKKTGEKGGFIIFMTDGDNKCGDYSRSLRGIVDQGAIVYTVAMSKAADANLESLAEATDGQSYFIQDPSDISQFIIEMQSLLIEMTNDGSTERLTIYTESVEIQTEMNNDVIIHLDQGLGDHVLVSAIYDFSRLDSMNGTMIPPAGVNGANSAECIDDSRKLVCELKFKPTPGSWTLRMRPSAATPTTSTVTVTASATVDTTTASTFSVSGKLTKPTISLLPPENFWQSSELDKSQPIVALVSFGRLAVLGAKVTAVVTREDGFIVRLPLRDNGEANNAGKGADLYENDGIYSGLFRETMQTGRYSVTLEVAATSEESFYTRDVLLGIPKSAKHLSETANFRHYITFTRIRSIGSFTVSSGTTLKTASNSNATDNEDEDVVVRIIRQRVSSLQATLIPTITVPGRISKLNMVHSQFSDSEARFTFIWTALEENPSFYKLTASTDMMEVAGRSDEIEVHHRVDGRLVQNVIVDASGNLKDQPLTATVTLPLSQWKIGSKVYFSVTAANYDSVADKTVAGEPSNIVLATVEQPENGYCDTAGCKKAVMRHGP